MKKPIYFIYFAFLLVFSSLCFAQQQSLGTYKINDCVNLIQSCANCTYINFTAVLDPDSIMVLTNVEATKQGTMFNYSFCNTSKEGQYLVYGVGDIGGNPTIFAYDFEINAAGQEVKSSITSFPIAMFLIIINIAAFWMFFKKDVTQNKYTNFIIRRAFLLAGIYLLMWNSSIMASIAASAGLPLTTEMFTYMQIFGWAGYIAMTFIVFGTIIQTMGEWKADKNRRRMGEE